MERYIITEQELLEKGLILSELALYPQAVIELGYDLSLTRIARFNDNLNSDEEIINAVSDSQAKIDSFKTLQYRIIYNLIYGGTEDIYDKYVDDIICHRLKLGSINGFQKSIWGVVK